MANAIKYGLRNLHVAFRLTDDSSSSGEPVWDTPVAVPGAIGLKLTPEGDEVKIYADDTVHFTATMNNGYSADLEAALIPSEVLADMLNWIVDANGMVVELADALPAPFALMAEVQGDEAAGRIVFYECRAARPAREEKTKEATIAASTDTLKLSIIPLMIDGTYYVKGAMDLGLNNQAAYDAFFDDVLVPEPV